MYVYRQGARATGRPAIGGERVALRVGRDVKAAIDRRTRDAVNGGAPPGQARSRVIRRMLAEGVGVRDGGTPVPITTPGSGRAAEPERVTLDRRLSDVVSAETGNGPVNRRRAEILRGLLILSLIYDGPADELPPTWVAAYEAALSRATPEQEVALRARLGLPAAEESVVAASVGLSVAAYKSRVARALRGR